MSAPVLLEARGIVKAYRREVVLRDVNLAVAQGELIGVVGENGSGKTTLLKVLAGLLRPDAGQVRIRGRLGYCPQEPLVFGDLTVRENFRYFAAAQGLRHSEPSMDALLQRLGFAAKVDERASRLSGGTRQKLNLAISLLHEPGVLLLDEPYSAFDWRAYGAFWDLAAQLRAEGRALIVVSPLLHDRQRFDRIYEVWEGVLQDWVPESRFIAR